MIDALLSWSVKADFISIVQECDATKDTLSLKFLVPKIILKAISSVGDQEF